MYYILHFHIDKANVFCKDVDIAWPMFSVRENDAGDVREVSVYDIKEHPDYKFRMGQVVVRVGGFEVNQ